MRPNARGQGHSKSLETETKTQPRGRGHNFDLPAQVQAKILALRPIWPDALKVICSDFLVVKVNCWWYVFNVIKSI